MGDGETMEEALEDVKSAFGCYTSQHISRSSFFKESALRAMG
jgi:predicted RNase H-like HicB family nuclease